jgi:hypothetical protein
MIQIQSPRQFTRAAERLCSEHMRVTRHESGFYRVQNLTKNHTYFVRVSRRGGKTFGKCTCEAGTPTNRRGVPVVCKHLCAVVMLLRAVREMRRRARSH